MLVLMGLAFVCELFCVDVQEKHYYLLAGVSGGNAGEDKRDECEVLSNGRGIK